jgi:hypothetical protein
MQITGIYDAPKVAHVASCRELPSTAVPALTGAVLAADRLTRHHSCIPPYNAPAQVMLADADDAPHGYEPSCIWPAGEPRPRCRACRGTHPGERHWLYPTIA